MHKTPRDIIAKKVAGKKISVVTAYDYSLALLCDRAGVDVLLVGDSGGMVMLGYENTIPVTMTQMKIFTEAVSRARQNALVVGDLPFMSYQANISDAIKNSGKLIKAGADTVKLEGGIEMAETIKAIVDTGIPVMGHIGLQPQTTMLSQGYRVQGKTKDTALKLIESAKALPEPMPIVGTEILSEIIFATSEVTISSAILNTPASSKAFADSINCIAVSAVFPCTRYPSDSMVVCGCSPM